MKILFMHPNCPGQYKHLCPAFADDPENQVVFISKNNKPIDHVYQVRYQLRREVSAHAHRYLRHTEEAVLQGQEVYRVLKKLRHEEGFVPDVVVAHPGWGDALYVKDIYPEAKLFGFFEFYYHSSGADVGFDPADPVRDDDLARVRTKNMHHLSGLTDCDWGISPTLWQHSLHPKEFQHKITPIHDGINTDMCKPDPNATYTLPNGKVFKVGDEVVTYVARNFEPYRGFPTFMQAAEKILKDRPNCHIIAAGADEVSYGRKAPDGKTYRQIWMEKTKLDTSRIHFVGMQRYEDFIKLLQISAAHIYLTYPFVLSWSSMEAMATGCAMVVSDTAPLREVITHGENGYMVDFFDPDALANQVYQLLDAPDRNEAIRAKARADMIHKYDLKKLIPLHMGLIKEVASGLVPPPTHDKVMALYSDMPSFNKEAQ